MRSGTGPKTSAADRRHEAVVLDACPPERAEPLHGFGHLPGALDPHRHPPPVIELIDIGRVPVIGKLDEQLERELHSGHEEDVRVLDPLLHPDP